MFRKIDLDDDLPECVASKLKEAIFHAPSSPALSMIGLVCFGPILWWRTHDIWLVAIIAVCALLLVFKTTILFLFKRRKQRGDASHTAAQLALVNTISGGLALAVAALLIRAIYLDEIISIELATMAVGVCLVGIVTRSTVPRLAIPQLFLLLAPLVAATIIAGDTAHILVGSILIGTFFSYASVILEAHERIKGRHVAEYRLSVIARTDHLTGLSNRTGFREQGSVVLECARSGHGDCVIGLLDLDGFKSVNDTYGHGVGDELLKQVGLRIKKVLEHAHFPVRLGGDEFAVVFDPDTNLDNVIALGKKIVTSIKRPYKIGAVDPKISGSMGLACFESETDTLSSILERADRALYQAKNGGKDQVRWLRVAELAPSLAPKLDEMDASARANVTR